ncbi:hypothetical protein BRD19_09800 [Halobacteriales archaeon SW_7_65_23]|nr:MAG: hypothetical protein BRD19_09800 [Halobacteriales archaeon SW_7_65_23]
MTGSLLRGTRRRSPGTSSGRTRSSCTGVDRRRVGDAGRDRHAGIELEWPGDETEIEIDVVASKATFELFEDSGGKWRWRLVHDNGNIIADGGQGYSSKQKANTGGCTASRRTCPARRSRRRTADDRFLTNKPPLRY